MHETVPRQDPEGDPPRDVYVLGINAYDHDVSACLLRNGEIVAAIAKERLTRVKHDSGFYGEVVDYCLAAGRISPERVDRVVMNTYLLPVPTLERFLLSSHQPYHMTPIEKERALRHPYFLGEAPKINVCSHHLAHAYSAFAVSPFDEGAVMVVDAIGGHRVDVVEVVPEGDETHPHAREAESYYRFRGTEIEALKKTFMGPVKGIVNDDFQNMPDIGAVYSRVSTYIFGHWNKCGEVMGLAPFGTDASPRLFEIRDGDLVVHSWPEVHRDPFQGGSDRVWNECESVDDWKDLAWRVQDDTEEVLLERARWLHEETGSENLVMAGGVALNCVANGRILRESPFKRIFVQPAAGDDGIAIGCALYGHLKLLDGKRTFDMRSVALGREYGDKEIAKSFSGLQVRMATKRRRVPDVIRETARILADGKTLGWFQGRSEFGPRALGNRCILGDPRDSEMKDRINAQVKHRQSFRPFAPAVLAERAEEFFEGEAESPFMLIVKKVRAEMRGKVSAIVHTDGTARVQTVRQEDNPLFHALISEFGRLTGVPVLLNTSFNLRGDPIVETPDDAVECYLMTKLDVLVMGDWIITKSGLHRATAPFSRYGMKVRRALRSGAVRERLGETLLYHS